jgi:hypothetical protein
MTPIQQVMLELEMDYIGHPYYVTGNAILHAIAADLSYDQQRKLSVSHGVFTPGQFGRFPTEHSQNGTRPGLGSTLPDVETYDDLFVHRDPAQPWLLDSRPRDALNTHDMRVQSDHPAIAPETVFGKPEDAWKETDTTTWYLQFYLHDNDTGILPLKDDLLDGMQLGGKRNYGYGMTRLKDTQLVNLDAIDFSRLESADEYLLELMTPYVTDSEHPKTEQHDIPWWWEHDTPLRRRSEKIVEQREGYDVTVVDHGQVVGYGGSEPVKTAKNGVFGIGTHSKYGFGELRVKPLGVDEDRAE